MRIGLSIVLKRLPFLFLIYALIAKSFLCHLVKTVNIYFLQIHHDLEDIFIFLD